MEGIFNKKAFLTILIVTLSLLWVYYDSTRRREEQGLLPTPYQDQDGLYNNKQQQKTAITNGPKPENNNCSSSEFLEAIQHGKWVMREPGSGELEELTSCIQEIRSENFHMPASLQRPDRKCGGGNNLIGTYSLESKASFKALCDPNGATPCCFANQCVNKTVAECKCPDCLDVRSRLHANFGSWELENAVCKIPMWDDRKSVCDLLNGHSIHIIGDSFMMQMYLSLFDAVSAESLWKANGSDSKHQRCSGEKLWLKYHTGVHQKSESIECDRTVSLRISSEYYNAGHAWKDVIKGLLGKPNSVLVFGIGIHDKFNFPLIRDKVIDPMLKIRGNNIWPRIVWFTPHVPGILKSKVYAGQERDDALKYAAQMMDHLKGKIHNVATVPFTEGMVSYDGTHYGKAINDLKVRILLTLIDKNNKQGWDMKS